jgi:hypothetical protein
VSSVVGRVHQKGQRHLEHLGHLGRVGLQIQRVGQQRHHRGDLKRVTVV